MYPPPLSFPSITPSHAQLVELKNGVTFNGHLVDCDNFMNVTLREVYQTSADGERFWKMKEMFIKGNVVRTGLCSGGSLCSPSCRLLPCGLPMLNIGLCEPPEAEAQLRDAMFEVVVHCA